MATRRSPLALAQARFVARQIEARGVRVELVPVVTRGDVDQAPLASIGGAGVFVAAVREALVLDRADIAVHSLKDLPTRPDARLRLAAVPRREDPRDVLVSAHPGGLAGLPTGARVGTGSPRRHVQLADVRPDLRIEAIRGNVDTRIGRVGASAAEGDLDAVVLAAAGLARLGRQDAIAEHLDPDVMVPAPGQGALAIEVRADWTELDDILSLLEDWPTRVAVLAERTVLATAEAGCSAPLGALAQVTGRGPEATLHLRAVMARADGSLMQTSITGRAGQAEQLGREIGAHLLSSSQPTHLGGTNP